MQEKLIIGLGYRARSGKDTVGDYLEQKHKFVSLAFADKLKVAVGNIVSDDPWRPDFKTDLTCLGLTGGQALQQIGVKLREVDTNIWIKAAGLDSLLTYTDTLVVTDVRFKNEAAEIKRLGGILVEVWRPGLPDDDHISEREGREIKWDYVLDNSGTLDQLYEKVEGLLKWVRSVRIADVCIRP